ncbi:hypothetical protein ZIOFF_069639 [Zingiber officinale]|uniref:Uncharacterized protein n=1 Tax=Zingiber officinale TaxID=94328 RepID=A0A8J5CBZ4_ZINOF|nr:hypothetical protein ZIOFF_069639 [Zingiber officinale]
MTPHPSSSLPPLSLAASPPLSSLLAVHLLSIPLHKPPPHPFLITSSSCHALDATSIHPFSPFSVISSLQGVVTTCYVALHTNLRGVTGKYFDDYNEEDTSNHAKDEELARKVLDLSEKMVKANE